MRLEKITVGQMKEALAKFDDNTEIMLNIKDDYDTYDIDLEIDFYHGPGISDNENVFFNNGECRIDLRLRAWSDDYPIRKPMRAKVIKRKK